jgi:hypothetical protein
MSLLICSTLHFLVTVSKMGIPFPILSMKRSVMGLFTVTVYSFFHDCFWHILLTISPSLVMNIKPSLVLSSLPIENTFRVIDVINNVISNI